VFFSGGGFANAKALRHFRQKFILLILLGMFQ
jgi:hypothetical protein